MRRSSGNASGSSGDPHGPISLDHYLHIHERYLEDRDWFIVHNELELTQLGSQLRISGNLYCLHGLIIAVDKLLVRDPPNTSRVRTDSYGYHVMIDLPDGTRRDLFRYDNRDDPVIRDKPDRHHRHEFDPRTGGEYGTSPRWIGQEQWPHLSDVIDEAIHWWQTTGTTVIIEEFGDIDPYLHSQREP